MDVIVTVVAFADNVTTTQVRSYREVTRIEAGDDVVRIYQGPEQVTTLSLGDIVGPITVDPSR